MNCREFGTQHHDVIILLHGGGLSWWNFRDVAATLSARYRVIVPILDGHAGGSDDFTSIEANAERIIAHIDEHFGGHVHALGGLSLGAQILTEILATRPDICSYALIESALVKPMPLTHALLAPSINMSYGLIAKPWFAKAQFRALHIRDALFPDYYRDSCAITKSNMLAFLQANASFRVKQSIAKTTAKTLIIVGGKEQQNMRSSAKMLQTLIPESELRIIPGYTHGDLSLNHPQQYVEELLRLMG